MDEILRFSLLYDFYGELLTKKQAEAFEMYYFDDFSLNEIAEKYSTSRQAVSDLINRTGKILESYEDKLKLLEKHIKKEEIVSRINDVLISEPFEDIKLNQIKMMLQELL